MARLNALISRWKLVSGAWSPRIPPHGANTWSGLSMLIILCLLLLLVCLLFTVFGYQPPVFPANEWEVTVPAAQVMVRRCRRIWAAARQILIHQGDRVKKAADRKWRPAPNYQPSQRVWLSAKDLHLRVPSKKLVPRFVGPFPISRVIGPAAVQLRLARSLRVHPTIHVSQVKPVIESTGPTHHTPSTRSDRWRSSLQGQTVAGGSQPGQTISGRLGRIWTIRKSMGSLTPHC